MALKLLTLALGEGWLAGPVRSAGGGGVVHDIAGMSAVTAALLW